MAQAQNLYDTISAGPQYIIFSPAILAVKKLVNNRKQQDIFEFISENPGCIISDISKTHNMYRSTIRHYIEVLESEGKIVLVKVGKFSRIFPKNSTLTDKEKIAISYFESDPSRRILFEIFDSEGLTNQELSSRLGMDRSATYHYLQKFIQTRIILYKIEGKYKRYYLYDDIKNLMYDLL